MSIRWSEHRKRFIIDYYPDGRYGKRERITLPETVTDEGTARGIEQDLRRAAPKSRRPVYEVHVGGGGKIIYAAFG